MRKLVRFQFKRMPNDALRVPHRLRKWVAKAALCGFALAALPANASDFMACFPMAAKAYGVNQYLLEAIALHESNMNPKANNTENFDDSEDIGIMQVNSWWLNNSLQQYGIDREKLWSPCLNIHIGAWILAQEVQKHGHGWKAVGYYNARTGWKRERYIGWIQASLRRVYDAYGISSPNTIDPVSPITVLPTRKAEFRSREKWDRAVSPRKSQERKTVSTKPRRIIVVSADQPQEHNG